MKVWKMVWLSVIFLLLAACGGGGELEIQEAWGRTSPMASQNGAFYMTIVNNTGQDEQLLGAAAEVCGATELHETYMRENDVMGMRQVPNGVIEIPAGETVELKVGGLHVMCIDKASEFNAGDEIPITLTFANGGERTVTAVIRDMAPDMDMDMDS